MVVRVIKKVGLFEILKDIKNKGVKISDDDKMIGEIKDYVQNLKDKGIKVNTYNEMTEEIKHHVKKLKDEGIKVKADDDVIKNLMDKIFKKIDKRKDKKKDEKTDERKDEKVDERKDEKKDEKKDERKDEDEDEIKKFLENYDNKRLDTSYKEDDGIKININGNDMYKVFKKFINKETTDDRFLEEYNNFSNKVDRLVNFKRNKKVGLSDNQKSVKKLRR